MAANKSAPRVLVADPEEKLREGISEILKRQGLQVIEAENGEQALKILLGSSCQVALVELHLPDMEGIELLASLKQAKVDCDVIIITAQGTIEKAVSAIRMGAQDVITKPFVPWLLKKAVGRALELRKLARERDRLAEERNKGLWAITTEKSRLKAVINSMSEGVLITDQDGGIVLCNPAFTKLMEMDYSCVIGSRVEEHPNLAALHRLIQRLKKDSEDARLISREIKIKQDPPLYINARVNSVRSGKENVLGLITVLEDITLFKEMDRKKSDFVAMVSHELKAPLAVLDTQAKVILRALGKDLDEKQIKMLYRMQKRVKGAMEMINDLLDLTRIEDQGVVRKKSLCSLNGLAKQACGLLKDQASEKDHILDFAWQDELPDILADAASIKEVVVNLLGNAIRYTPQGGKIKIQTGLDKGYAYLSVADTGIGIDVEDQKRIFERFFRVKSEKTRDIVGTGLGLPIVKAIVEDHRGFITLDSDPQKGGSNFTVFLPAMV